VIPKFLVSKQIANKIGNQVHTFFMKDMTLVGNMAMMRMIMMMVVVIKVTCGRTT